MQAQLVDNYHNKFLPDCWPYSHDTKPKIVALHNHVCNARHSFIRAFCYTAQPAKLCGFLAIHNPIRVQF